MENLESNSPVLNDLIRLNNDRIAGYEKAIKELNDGSTDLQAVFHDAIVQSYQFIAGLEDAIENSGGNPKVDETTLEGKIYRSWMDIKEILIGNDRKAILKSCIAGEDAIYSAYTDAHNIKELPTATHLLIAQQKQSLALFGRKILALYNREV